MSSGRQGRPTLDAIAAILMMVSGCAVGTIVPDDGGAGGAIADGTGGASGTGGRAGTGGASTTGTGGASATGGRPGTGGASTTGTGGAVVVPPGTGGQTGAGGAADAGSGIGGRPGTGGASDAGTSGDAGGAVLLSDDFESAGVGDRWITDPALGGDCGDWAVLADGDTHVYQEQMSCSSNPSWAAGGDTRWTDMTVQVQVKLVTPSSSTRIVVAVRFQDEKNYYVLEYTPDGKIKLRTKIAGSSTDVATNASNARVPVVTGAWNTIGLSVSGPASASTVSASLNGNPVLTGTATGLASGGVAIGAQAAVAAFDNVIVTRP